MNSRTNSLIGHASSNDLRIALHYEDAARILYESDAYQDHIVLPSLFLIRQFLELSLKYNIRKLNKVSSSNFLVGKLNQVHDLDKIHEAFLEHYKSVKTIQGKGKILDKKYLDSLNEIIKKISLLDSSSQGFRYTENTTGEKIIPVDENYNLKDVFDLLEDTSNFLTNLEEEFGLTNEG